MKFLLTVLVGGSLLLNACVKSDDCGCVEPTDSAQNWKITLRTGSINGTSTQLTDDQKNSILTIVPDGSFKVKNTLTNVTVNGTYKMSDYASIYGQKRRIVFTPNLPMLSNDFHILMDGGTASKFILGDNITDGYSTTFTVQP